MTIFYAVLFAAIATGVMQTSLDKAGVGRVEATVPSVLSNTLVLLSIPITWFSNIGLIVVTIWSFFALPWLPTLGVVSAAFRVPLQIQFCAKQWRANVNLRG